MTSAKPVRALSVAVVLVLVATVAVWWSFFGATERRITAYFTAAVGIYPGGDVRILGVPVGTVDAVVPQGTLVRVEMSLDRDVQVPADAGAVAVAPSVVSDRYVQLTPVYRGGPVLGDGAVIPHERTAIPVELDQIYRSLDELTRALGPGGANADGALTDLLNTGAANLDGNGQTLAETIRNLGEVGTTLSGTSDQLFATVDNLQKFTTMLARNDDQVRRFTTQMQQVSSFLAGEREDMSAAMAELAVALGRVEAFVRDNRELLKSNVDQLNSVATVLVRQKAALSESLRNAPLALSNLNNAYNGASGTLDTRADINELNQPPVVAVCKLLQQHSPADVPKDIRDACAALQPVLDGVVQLPTLAETLNSVQHGTLPPLPLPLSGSTQPAGGVR
ncbi:ABC transporter substrate-binding protein [Saccharopolyspora subtropica]|uniref:ABC transporter substrate-binding protein n=1 Tax=Saccharopolyspora thermophila TaxID=89367 RepID=A0A917K0Q1_9PSEU|nr:MCE family protein [Saccharopolyspora subtropica]GGI93730.1 ABC transporter substrate-binding protein [Saccharopolyspora subtropica]